MNRCIVNVSTGRFLKGQNRLRACEFLDGTRQIHNGVNVFDGGTALMTWDKLPPGSPSHEAVPFAFKAYAVKAAADAGYTTLIWADASIIPIAPLEPLWERIETKGYWFSKNGWKNGQWCTDAALEPLGITREEAFEQEHIVGGAFGLDFRHQIARECFAEYFRLASETRAFCGPLKNDNGEASSDKRILGHRHDQTSLSAIAHRLGMELTDPPLYFSYKGGEDSSTVLLAHGIC